jgi:hypothetical protein
MGHSSSRMTELYSGEIPLEEVRAAFSRVQASQNDEKKRLLEKMENEVAA